MAAPVPPAIRSALRRRGITLRLDDGGRDDLLVTTWSPAARDRFYHEMQRYSFRLVLRDAIRLGGKGSFRAEDLTRHANVRAVQGHLEAMTALSLVQPFTGRAGPRFKLVARASSLGPTLEWFVAEILRRELGFCVAWSLPMRGGSTGGDLDVVALAEGQLLLVEVKSGPPKHLNRSHVAAFLDRVQALAPHGAIFFEDTELRMADKIVVLFEEELANRGLPLVLRRLHRELFTVGPGVFIANAYPDVASNLGRCVSELFRAGGVQLDVDLRRGAR
jgi:hypothetical protein